MYDLLVKSRGDVSAAERGYCREKLERLIERSSARVQSAHVMLVFEGSTESAQATADAELDIGDRTVHATSAGDTVFGAVHELERALQLGFRALGVPSVFTGAEPAVRAPG
jgi:ribosome-associated translation inhibitor RaiA